MLGTLAGCVPEDVPLPRKPFAVRDGFIRDEDGRVVVLRGVNLSGHHKNAPYFDFHQPPDVADVRERLGMNSLRFLIEWAAVEPQRGVYDDAYLDEVRRRLDWAQDAGLLVMLDMHQDLYGEGFLGGNGAPPWTCDSALYAAYAPQRDWYLGYLDPSMVECFDRFWGSEELQDALAQAWQHVAERLGDHPAVIGFEPMNEPWLGSYGLEEFEPLALQPFYERVIGSVRKVAPHWLAFVEPMSMSNLGRDSLLEKMPFDDVVYAPHSYDGSFERGQGFGEANRVAVLEKLQTLQAEARRMGAALWIGEYGGDATLEGIDRYMDAEYDAFASMFAGSAYWDYSRGDGFGIVNEDGTEKTVLWDAIVRPAPERVDGVPTGWSYDEATRVFSLEYKASGKADTIVRVPARVYPAGVVVDCSDCEARADGDTLTITAETDVDVAVVVRPAG